MEKSRGEAPLRRGRRIERMPGKGSRVLLMGTMKGRMPRSSPLMIKRAMTSAILLTPKVGFEAGMNLDGRHNVRDWTPLRKRRVDILGGFLPGSVEDIASIFLLVGGGLNVEGVQSVATLGKKVKTNGLALEEGVYKWCEIGTDVEVAGQSADCQVNLCGKDGEQSVVEGNVGIKMHIPELGSHLQDIIRGQVYGGRVSAMLFSFHNRKATHCMYAE